jgi:hypothetical protein
MGNIVFTQAELLEAETANWQRNYRRNIVAPNKFPEMLRVTANSER